MARRGLVVDAGITEVTLPDPQEGPQTAFLACEADIAGYGGAAGGGKTWSALRWVAEGWKDPLYTATIFRRSLEEIKSQGSLRDNADEFMLPLGAKANRSELTYTFPEGGTVKLDSMLLDRDRFAFQGAQICRMVFEEATHFTIDQFIYLFSRARSMCGITKGVRLTFNPDPDTWVFRLFAPWVDPKHPLFPADPGHVLWMTVDDNEFKFVPEGTEFAKSITYFPALVHDNKILLDKNPDYLSNLNMQTELEKERLLYGRWTSMEAPGALWTRELIHNTRVEIDDVPDIERSAVAVDPAASVGPDSDETGIIVASRGVDGHVYVMADASGKWQPERWATLAVSLYHQHDCESVVAEKNMGGDMVRTTVHQVERVKYVGIHAKKNKEVRAGPVKTLMSKGKLHLVGHFPALEGQMTRYVPGITKWSPDRMDAMVYAVLAVMEPYGTSGGRKDKKTSKPKGRSGMW